MKLVIELAFIVIFVVAVWSGYKKGLVMTLGSIFIIIVSLFVGDLFSDTFAHEAIPAVRPFVAGYMEGAEGSIEKALSEVAGDTSDLLSTDDIVESRPGITLDLCRLSYQDLGVYSSSAEQMAEEAVALHEQGGITITASIVEIMCQKLTYYLGFILFFAVTVILLTVLGNISNLSFKIPEMDLLNTIGGAAAGLVVGYLFCAFAAWALKFTGAVLPTDELGGLAKIFINADTLSKYLSI